MGDVLCYLARMRHDLPKYDLKKLMSEVYSEGDVIKAKKISYGILSLLPDSKLRRKRFKSKTVNVPIILYFVLEIPADSLRVILCSDTCTIPSTMLGSIDSVTLYTQFCSFNQEVYGTKDTLIQKIGNIYPW